MGEARPRRRLGFWIWAGASLALHGSLIGPLVTRNAQRASAAHAPSLWMSAVQVAAPKPVPPPPPPPPPEPPRERAKVAPRRVARAQPTATPASTEAPGQGLRVDGESGTAFASGDGGVAVGEGGGSAGTGSGSDGDRGPVAEEAAGEPQRPVGPAELSLWMDVEALGSRALVRPGLGFLMSVPGLREALRGSGIRPFIDLQRARIRLAGRAPERLTLAGTHVGGEPALLAAAEQIAAMRGRQLNWRGGSDLRASSWVDGSGVDRALAVHGAAFVIAERSALPALLEAPEPGQQVRALSQLRERVVLALAVEDAAVYLPGLRSCELDALRLSIALAGAGRGNASGIGYQLALTAHYRKPSSASGAQRCLRELTVSPSDPLSRLVDWLVRAQGEPGSHAVTLKTGVTGDDIEQLLNGLAWALRPQR